MTPNPSSAHGPTMRRLLKSMNELEVRDVHPRRIVGSVDAYAALRAELGPLVKGTPARSEKKLPHGASGWVYGLPVFIEPDGPERMTVLGEVLLGRYSDVG